MPDAGYSGTPLTKKLGLRSEDRALFVNPPETYEASLELDGVVTVTALEADLAFIHYFSTELAALERDLPALKASLRKDGILWLSWPKRSSGVATTLTETGVREAGLAAGLVDVKVAAIDAVWSGLKFVWRLRDR